MSGISTAFPLAGDSVSTGDWLVLVALVVAIPVLFWGRAEYDRWQRQRQMRRRAKARCGYLGRRR
jgi:hypothetical protein